jgi:hypothetical protein
MDPRGSSWILVDPDGSWWILVDHDGSWWILVDPRGSSWILGSTRIRFFPLGNNIPSIFLHHIFEIVVVIFHKKFHPFNSLLRYPFE